MAPSRRTSLSLLRGLIQIREVLSGYRCEDLPVTVQFCTAFTPFIADSLRLHDGIVWTQKPEGQKMDRKKLKVARQRLAEEYEDLSKSMKRGRLAANEIRVENTEDEGDLAIISHARELFYNLQEGDLARLRSIEEAMEALERGQYGECIRCDDDINERRLEVVPWATMCIRCQEETEMEASSQTVLAGMEGEGPEL
jgi:DnaK suppressor protein